MIASTRTYIRIYLKTVKTLVVFLGILLLGMPLKAADFYVDSYGAAPNNASVNSASGILAAIEAAKQAGGTNRVILSAGTYYMAPAVTEQASIVAFGANNISIEGQGTTGPNATHIVITDPRGGGFQFIGGDNVVIKNFTYDHGPLPFTQGVVVAKNRTANYFDISVDAGYPDPTGSWYTGFMNGGISTRWCMIFEPGVDILKPDAPDFVFLDSNVQNLGGGVYRFQTNGEASKINTMDIGDRIAVLIRPVIPGPITFYQTNYAIAENIHIYSSSSICVTGLNTVRTTVRNCRAEVKPGTNRLVSSNADAWHFQQDRVGPIIENNYAEAMADDGVAINCFPTKIESVTGARSLTTDSVTDIRLGDNLIIFNPRDGIIMLDTTVVGLSLSAPPPTGKYSITLADDLPALTLSANTYDSDHIYNRSSSGQDYIVRGNEFQSHRGRNIFVQAADGVIEDNTLHQTQGFSIVVANEPSWPLGPIPARIEIRNNTIINGVLNTYWFADTALAAAIQVRGSKGTLNQVAEGRLIQDVLIDGNTIINPPATGIYVAAAENVRIQNNHISADGTRLAPKVDDAIIIENAAGVVVKNNQIDDSPTLSLFRHGVRIESDVDLGCDGVIIQGLNATVYESGVGIYDLRTPVGPWACLGSVNIPVNLEVVSPDPIEPIYPGDLFSVEVTFPDKDIVISIDPANDFNLGNCSYVGMSTGVNSFIVDFQVNAPGAVALSMPPAVFTDIYENPNLSSNTVGFNATPAPFDVLISLVNPSVVSEIQAGELFTVKCGLPGGNQLVGFDPSVDMTFQNCELISSSSVSGGYNIVLRALSPALTSVKVAQGVLVDAQGAINNASNTFSFNAGVKVFPVLLTIVNPLTGEIYPGDDFAVQVSFPEGDKVLTIDPLSALIFTNCTYKSLSSGVDVFTIQATAQAEGNASIIVKLGGLTDIYGNKNSTSNTAQIQVIAPPNAVRLDGWTLYK